MKILVSFFFRKCYVKPSSGLSFIFNGGNSSLFVICFVSIVFRVMLWKLSFVFLVFLLGSVRSNEDSPAGTSTKDNENTEQKFSQEFECSRAGGICIPRENCPPEKVSEEGQCPKQSNLGAVCCHSLSITETRCQQLGGHCRESCPEEVIIGRANDCPNGEKCCPLV